MKIDFSNALSPYIFFTCVSLAFDIVTDNPFFVPVMLRVKSGSLSWLLRIKFHISTQLHKFPPGKTWGTHTNWNLSDLASCCSPVWSSKPLYVCMYIHQNCQIEILPTSFGTRVLSVHLFHTYRLTFLLFKSKTLSSVPMVVCGTYK